MGGVVGGLAGGLVNSAIGSAGLNQAGVNSPIDPATLKAINEQQQAAQAQQQNFVNALMGVNGIQNQQNVFNQLQDVASGQGPNPAQAMLNQATGSNVANQAALMASARGASANPALIARQAAMAGTNAQQQAAGQAANLQANQSLGALNQLGGLANQQVAQQQQGLNSLTQGALGAQGNALGAQNSNNQLNAQIEGGNKQTQRNMFGQVAGALGSGMQFMPTGGSGGAAPAGADGGMVQPKSAYAQAMMAGGGGIGQIAGLVGGAMMGGPQGAQIGAQLGKQYDQSKSKDGGGGQGKLDPGTPGLQLGVIGGAPAAAAPMTAPAAMPMAAPVAQQATPKSSFGQMLGEMFGMGPAKAPEKYDSSAVTAALYGAPGTRNADGTMSNDAMATLMKSDVGNVPPPAIAPAQAPAPVMNDFDANWNQAGTTVQRGPAMAEGGKVPALVSPGERYLPPQEVKKVAKGEKPAIKAGEKIPGKPMYPGNDYRNDVVPKKLDEGGIVLPNSVMQSKDPAKEAHKFVSAILAKQGKAMPKKPKKDAE